MSNQDSQGKTKILVTNISTPVPQDAYEDDEDEFQDEEQSASPNDHPSEDQTLLSPCKTIKEKKIKQSPEVSEKYVTEFLDEMCLDLVPELIRATRSQPKQTNHVFNLKDGVYVEVRIFKTESALGDQIMKSDHWEGVEIIPLVFEGCPNFRVVEGTQLFGCGQPSHEGLIKALGHLEQVGFEKVLWVNLREEPVTYMNGTPFAPRDRETLNINLDHLIGIEGMDLEHMEQRMKADLIRKAHLNNYNLEYAAQDKQMNNQIKHMLLNSKMVFTPKELFGMVSKEQDVLVEYFRIPITDECAPEEKDFDELVNTLKDTTPTTGIVFNCQMGRGRTTTGLVCAYLYLYTHRHYRTPHKVFKQAHQEPPSPIATPSSTKYNVPDPKTPNYDNGEFGIILQLLTILPQGAFLKYQVDQAIDACQQVQNLRLAINECRVKFLQGGPDAQKYFLRGKNYLERYWWLIVFNAYLHEQAPLALKKKFSDWMKDRWGLKRILKKSDLL